MIWIVLVWAAVFIGCMIVFLKSSESDSSSSTSDDVRIMDTKPAKIDHDKLQAAIKQKEKQTKQEYKRWSAQVKRDKRQKLFNKTKNILFNILICLVLTAIILVPLVIAFQDVYDVIYEIGGGSVIVGIIVTPFAIIGGINFLRGFGAVLEMDEEKYGHIIKKDWQLRIYFFFHICSYIALFYVIIKGFNS